MLKLIMVLTSSSDEGGEVWSQELAIPPSSHLFDGTRLPSLEAGRICDKQDLVIGTPCSSNTNRRSVTVPGVFSKIPRYFASFSLSASSAIFLAVMSWPWAIVIRTLEVPGEYNVADLQRTIRTDPSVRRIGILTDPHALLCLFERSLLVIFLWSHREIRTLRACLSHLTIYTQ